MIEIRISVNNENEFFFKSIERQKYYFYKKPVFKSKSVVILVH
jgi:hypothetical protein